MQRPTGWPQTDKRMSPTWRAPHLRREKLNLVDNHFKSRIHLCLDCIDNEHRCLDIIDKNVVYRTTLNPRLVFAGTMLITTIFVLSILTTTIFPLRFFISVIGIDLSARLACFKLSMMIACVSGHLKRIL